MRTFFIFTASAVLLAAVIVELSTRLWPGSSIALLVIATIALLAQGYLSLRLGGGAKSANATNQSGNRQRSRSKSNDGAKSGQQGRDRNAPKRERSDKGERSERGERSDKGGRSERGQRAEKDERSETTEEEVPTGDRESGTVKWFNRTKGFGFIVRESGEEIFVHQRSIRSEGSGDNRRRPSLKDDQPVTFVVANREKGLQAEDVTPA